MFLQETNDLEFQTLELRGNLLFVYVCLVWRLQTKNVILPDIGIVIVRDILHSKHLTVLLRFLILWPERRI